MCNFSLRYNQHFVSFIEILANRIRRKTVSVVTSIRPHYDQVIGKLLSSEAITDLCNQAEYK